MHLNLASIRSAIATASFLICAVPVASAADRKPDAPVTEAELAKHIQILSSDAFEGRSPGSEGEDRTIAYVVGELAKLGLEPAGDSSTPWLQGVPLIETEARGGSATFKVRGREFRVEDGGVVLTGRDPSGTLHDTPLVFVGFGVDGAGKINADVRGKIAIMLYADVPFGSDLPDFRARRQMLADAGASAVLVAVSETTPWNQIKLALSAKTTRFASDKVGAAITGFISFASANALLNASGQDAIAARAAARSPDYKGVVLPVTADLAATAIVRPYVTNNIIAKLPGAKPDGKSVLFLGHWDHMGFCALQGAPDRICNGAVDNASGIAVLLAVAKRLASGYRSDRDIYFMATTAEEKGLLGAKYFVEHPVVPLDAITVALNVDTIAIAPRGAPVATVGRGKPAYDAVIRDVATNLGRKLDEDGEADDYVDRQDGWALGAKGVTSLMVGGSFSDMPLLEKFLESNYHDPDDEFSDQVPLGGAADDADLHVALGRIFADSKRWRGAPQQK